jgi:hypothetical protein
VIHLPRARRPLSNACRSDLDPSRSTVLLTGTSCGAIAFRCACVEGSGPARGGATDDKEARDGNPHTIQDDRRGAPAPQSPSSESGLSRHVASCYKRWVAEVGQGPLCERLVALQLPEPVPVRYEARERGIDRTQVTGVRTFLRFGRAVRKGKLALWVLARHTVTVKEKKPTMTARRARRSGCSSVGAGRGRTGCGRADRAALPPRRRRSASRT